MGRVALACVLLLDLGRRALDLRAFYSNEGLLPNHTVLWRPVFEWQFSFFFMASSVLEAALGMLLCAVAYSMLLVGFKTKLAQLASLACVVSLHTRTSFVGNGGDVVLGELALWTAFLPTGRRFSLDALLAAPEDPLARTGAPPATDVLRTPVVSIAVLGLTLQLAAIYLFNALNKTGATWRDGSAVHILLHHSGIVTPLGNWVRTFITPSESRAMTYFAWSVEALLPLLLVMPFARRFARRLVVVLMLILHSGFALFVNLGVFVPAMLAFAVHFVPREDWDGLERWWARRGNARERLRELAERVETLARTFVRKPTPANPAPAFAWLSGRAGTVREAAAGLLVLALVVQALFENPNVTKLSPEKEPTLLFATVSYLQAFQAWGMYAPDVPRTDLNVHVDALTAGGRHVDPFNEVASPAHPNPGPTIPSRLGQDNLFCAYVLRIAGSPDYHQAFSEWILRYPERTGRDEDRIVSFEAFLVLDESPLPGKHEPTDTRTERFIRFPER
jgi:hypothetical protein